MTTNDAGIKLLCSLEGCKLTAYKLSGEKYYTIGYGHYGADVKKGMAITKAQAVALLKSDLAKFEKHVTKYALAKFPTLNENQFSALVSYTYNRGQGGLKQLVNASSSIEEMGNNFPVYWGSATKYKTALINRRKKEMVLYFTAVSTATSVTVVIPTPTLVRGSKGTQVNYLQTFLNLNNPSVNLDVDGKFGNATYKALLLFQKNNGLTQTGKYDEASYNKFKELKEKAGL